MQMKFFNQWNFPPKLRLKKIVFSSSLSISHLPPSTLSFVPLNPNPGEFSPPSLVSPRTPYTLIFLTFSFSFGHTLFNLHTLSLPLSLSLSLSMRSLPLSVSLSLSHPLSHLAATSQEPPISIALLPVAQPPTAPPSPSFGWVWLGFMKTLIQVSPLSFLFINLHLD